MTPNATPGGRLVTVCGSPPLTIRKALPKAPVNLTIYGNTVDSVGVGVPTVNLFDEDKIILLYKNKQYTNFTGSYRIAPIQLKPDTTYYIKVMGTAFDRYGAVNVKLAAYGGNYINLDGTRISSYGQTKGLLTTSDQGILYISIHLTNNETVPALAEQLIRDLKLMIVEGVIEPDIYEPYGYRIPIEFTSPYTGDSTIFNAFSSSPLYLPSESITISSNDMPQLFKGDNIISVNTAAPPSDVSISYIK